MFELSEKKKEILAHDGHLLVHGGPGSGKTTISILKADLLVTNSLRPAQKVLFLSFARASVTRVLEALAEFSKEPVTRKRVSVETYHAFFWRILRTHGYLLGLPRKLEILAPAAQAVALASIRHKFGPVKKLYPDALAERNQSLSDELRRLAFEEGRICFDQFADLTAELLTRSSKIRLLVSTAYPLVILDEFQDTNSGQWDVVQQFGIDSTLIALADAEQRIYDFVGADPERLNHFRVRFAPKEFDLGSENHRSGGTDIATFGNDLLKGKFRPKYEGIRFGKFAANENQAFAALKGHTLQARKRLIDSGKNGWSLAILVPTKRMMRHISDAFRTKQENLPTIGHHAAIDMEGAILAAELIAFLLQPQFVTQDVDRFVGLLCDFFRGRGGDDPSVSDINHALAIAKALDRAAAFKRKGKHVPGTSIILPILDGYYRAKSLVMKGNPDEDWASVRDALIDSGCKRLAEVAEESRNVRLLERGTQLREALSLDWRRNGCYANALSIVRQALTQDQFLTASKPETGVVVMNMHKAKGKQFDEVIIFEGWPRRQKGKIVSNPDRIVRGNLLNGDLTHARQNFRVSVTRAKSRTLILTPEIDPCVLLLAGQ